MEPTDFFHEYFDFTKNTEPPYIFSRWSAIAGIAAILGRNFYLPFGEGNIYPNLYIQLLGEPGSRKSTAIKTMRKRVVQTGFTAIAADKSSKEKFLLDLFHGGFDDLSDPIETSPFNRKPVSKLSMFEGSIDDAPDLTTPREAFIVADEFNDFLGTGNLDFISLLGNLWDYDDVYRARVKNSKSVAIPFPTINILSGNTATNFAAAFPPEIMGQGFLSRLLIIHGEASGRKITKPPIKTDAEKQWITSLLLRIKAEVKGKATFTEEADKALDSIYQNWQGLDDVRFISYSTRRFTQLLKLTLIVSASKFTTQVDLESVIFANTILSWAEGNMPKALGEFGKSQYAEVSHKIMEVLYKTTAPLSVGDIWKHVYQDFKTIVDLSQVMQNLQRADKIQVVTVGDVNGFLPKKKVKLQISTTYIDYRLLTPQERDNA